MKLHLPKSLLVAVLAACVGGQTTWADFTGPANVTYNEVTSATNSAQTPTENTYYSNVTGGFSISTPEGQNPVHVKLKSSNNTDRAQYWMGTISASSTYITGGGLYRFGWTAQDNGSAVNDALTNAGDIYVEDGALNIAHGFTLSNNITLGTSSYAPGWPATVKNAALVVGYYGNVNKTVTLSGALTIAESARICMQSGYNLNLTGNLFGSANLEFSRYSNNGNANSIITFSGSAAGYTGNITINGFEQDNKIYTNTLKLTGTGTNLLTNAASITMGEKAKLDVDLSADVFRNIESKVQATEADGFINIVTNHDSDTEVKFTSNSNEDVNLTKKYNLTGHLSVHAGGQNAAVRIKGGTVNVTQDVNLITGGKLMIEGGVLSSRYVTLGHTSEGNYPGHLIMTSGALKTGAIKLIRSGRINTVRIEGGILEFTEADALVKQVGDYAKNTESTISIVGASTDTLVTLKANTTNWKIDGSGLTTLPSIGNVQVDSGNTHAITFEHVQLTGSIINNKLLSLGREVTVAEGATASLSGTGTTTIEGTLSISGSLSVGGTIQIADDFAGNYEDAGSTAVRTGNLSHGSNGFEEYTGYSSWYLVKHKEGANVSSSLAGATLADATYTLNEVDDGIVIRTVGDSYYDYQLGFTVNTGTVDVAALLADSGSHVTTDTKYVLKGGELAVKSGTFNANNVVTDSNDGGTIYVENGATLTNANNVAAITAGSGTIELSYDTSYNSVPNAGADFTGTTHIKEGCFTINGASFGNKLILDDGVNFRLSAGSTVTLAADKQLVLNGASEMHQNTNQSTGKGADFTVNGVVSGNGTYDRRGGGTLTFNNSVTLGAFKQENTTGSTTFQGNSVTLGNLEVETQTLTIAAKTATIGAIDTTFNQAGNNHATGLYIKNSVVNIGNGTDSTTVTTTRVEMGDNDANASGDGGTLNVKANAELIVTGSDVAGGYHTTGFLLGEWEKNSTLAINGKVLSQNASIMCGNVKGTVTVENGGFLATKGFLHNKDNSGSLELTLKDGGEIVLGSTGITAKTITTTFGAGTVGISSDSSISKPVTLNSATGTTFDTTKWIWAEGGASIAKGNDGGTLTIGGIIGGSGKLIKDGVGALELNATNTYSGGTEVKAGSLVAATGASLGTGGVTISGGKLEITNAGGDAKVEVAKLAASNTSASITDNGESGVQGSSYGTNYGIGYSNYTIENAQVAVTSDKAVTISNQLRNVALTNSGTGTITAGNGYNYYTDIEAISGNISLLGIGNNNNSSTQKALNSLVISEDKKVGAHSNWNVGIDEISKKATLTVAETATFGKNATLNANLTLNNGAVLTLGEGGLNMNNSVLTLGSSLTLNQETVQRIMELAEGKVALFTNVSELILGEQHYTAGSLTADNGGVALSEVFINLTMPTELTAAANTSYYLGFDGNGMVYAAQIVPEPTTATLSLLALAALAARRRRR